MDEERAYRVEGRVQGVGFRWWTHGHARRLGLSGTVRNRSDGSVEVRARGGAAALDELRRALESGPPAAAVSSVTQEPATDVPADGFHVVG